MAGSHDIAQWRAQVFSSLLSVVLVIGSIAAVPSVALSIREGMWPVVALDLTALGWIFGIHRLTRLPYTLRVLNFLAILFAIGIGLTLAVGPVSVYYLMAPPVMAAILLSTRAALIGLGIGSASILALSLGGAVPLQVPGLEQDIVLSSLVVTLNFACIGVLITLTCGTLLKGLSRSLSDVRSVAESLDAGQARLHTLNAELRLTSAALASLNDMVLIASVVDAPGILQPIIFANDAFLRRSGYQRADIIGRSMRTLHGDETDPAVVQRILQAMQRNEAVCAELLNYTKSGEAYWVETEISPFSSAGGRTTHWVAVGRDITDRRRSADAIHRLAFFDVLTGLPNRRLLMERLDALIAHAHAGRGLGAVLYIDLDNFKKVNDARGHAVGDALLVQAGERLAGVVRKGDTVARLGGDEFVVLLDGLGADALEATRAALAVANKVRRALSQSMHIDKQSYQSSASVGVALAGGARISAQDLLREADTAMYDAKGGGRDRVVLFDTAMLADAEHKLTLERDLANALDSGELAMHLQLQVDHERSPVGAELLMRWRRADGVQVPPDVFIPVAESSGLIVPLGHWVLGQACQAWLALEQAGFPMPLSINVSPLQFRQADFVARVRTIVAEAGVPPSQLIFEVTEGLLVEDLDQTIARMHELAALGIRFSVDDFGTGYSNLAYLKKMPLYELKIDKSFMRDTPHDVNGTAIVQSILALARHMGLRVVAEGIETVEQAQFLVDNGPACMQGYLFWRPMPLDELIKWLSSAG